MAPHSKTADRRGVYISALLKLRSYRTEVHQIFKQCRQIIADEPFEIGIASRYSTPFINAKATNEGE